MYRDIHYLSKRLKLVWGLYQTVLGVKLLFISSLCQVILTNWHWLLFEVSSYWNFLKRSVRLEYLKMALKSFSYLYWLARMYLQSDYTYWTDASQFLQMFTKLKRKLLPQMQCPWQGTSVLKVIKLCKYTVITRSVFCFFLSPYIT